MTTKSHHCGQWRTPCLGCWCSHLYQSESFQKHRDNSGSFKWRKRNPRNESHVGSISDANKGRRRTTKPRKLPHGLGTEGRWDAISASLSLCPWTEIRDLALTPFGSAHEGTETGAGRWPSAPGPPFVGRSAALALLWNLTALICRGPLGTEELSQVFI